MAIITEATQNDIPAIQQLAEKTWWPTYSAILDKKQIRYMLDTIYSNDSLLLAMNTGASFTLLSDSTGIQGFASFSRRKEDPMIMKLHKIYVLPQAHGKGYGRLLIEDIKKRCAAEKINTLDLNVNRYNPALNFYMKMGFKILREEDIRIGPYWMNDFVMRLVWE